MWEAIKDVLTSSNALIVIIFLMFFIIVAFVLIKSGWLNVHTENIKIGARDNERNIIRQQQDYVLLHLKSALNNMPKPEGYDKNLGELVIMAVYCEYVSWIAFNHLTKSEKYIAVKQNKLVELVDQYTYKEEFKTDEFKDLIRQDTKNTIYELINIREIYKD